MEIIDGIHVLAIGDRVGSLEASMETDVFKTDFTRPRMALVI